MQHLKSGKEEIIYLLTQAIEKFRIDTGQEIIQNTNRKNYEVFAIMLSDISNQLPFKFEELGTESYGLENNPKGQGYPHRKYDITGGQIKDALSGIVSNPRPFFIDACYIYLYGFGRKAFKQNPVDINLIELSEQDKVAEVIMNDKKKSAVEQEIFLLQNQNRIKNRTIKTISIFIAIIIVVLIYISISFISSRQSWLSIKKDMNILPYIPGKVEIDSLEGVWLCYTGSPQARVSDPARYHKVVSNLIDIKYKDGYFTYNRYGASFNHIGFMQFESAGIVSVYSKIKNNSNNTESPRHSLLNLDMGKKYLSAISASWNFDIGDKNKIIGIREVYIKMGKGGSIEEVINEVENASCQCKVIRWHQENKQVKTFYLKNQLLDTLTLKEIAPLIDENSILPSIPQDGLVMFKDSLK